MHGPPLSAREVTAYLERHIAKLEALGMSRPAAITATAAHYRADPAKVTELVNGAR